MSRAKYSQTQHFVGIGKEGRGLCTKIYFRRSYECLGSNYLWGRITCDYYPVQYMFPKCYKVRFSIIKTNANKYFQWVSPFTIWELQYLKLFECVDKALCTCLWRLEETQWTFLNSWEHDLGQLFDKISINWKGFSCLFAKMF